MDQPTQGVAVRPHGIGDLLNRLSILLAYCGGAIVAGVGIMSAISIIGRLRVASPDHRRLRNWSRSQHSHRRNTIPALLPGEPAGHIVVDLFTLAARVSTRVIGLIASAVC